MTTHIPKVDERDRQWLVLDAKDQVLGKLAATAAAILTGKTKPIYTPFLDTGDHVIVINADKIVLTANKAEKKMSYRHSGYPGGLKAVGYEELLTKHPERAIELAVKGMLPHNRLANRLIRKLKVYAGSEHPHAAQQPQPFEIKQIAQ